MSLARLLLFSTCGALAANLKSQVQKKMKVERRGGASSFPQWGDAQWTDSCWGTPDPEQQLSGEILKSICARLHQNASFLVFGLGRDSKLWYNNSISKNIVFLENHEDWLHFQDEDVRRATRIVKYTSDATKYKQELLDEDKLAELFLSLPKEITEADWDMILVDSPMGMETDHMAGFVASTMGMLGLRQGLHPVAGTPGRTQSVYAAKRMARQDTLVYVDDVHRAVEETATQELLRSPEFQTLKVFSSGHRDNNGIMGKTAMLLKD